MNVILLHDITTDPNAPIVSDTCHLTDSFTITISILFGAIVIIVFINPRPPHTHIHMHSHTHTHTHTQESLLEVLSEHIDTLADSSHYFVIDPSGTTIMNARMNEAGGVCGG